MTLHSIQSAEFNITGNAYILHVIHTNVVMYMYMYGNGNGNECCNTTRTNYHVHVITMCMYILYIRDYM